MTHNLLIYCAQIGVVIAVSALVARLTGLKAPDARLAWWQIVLLACLALPALRPWNAPQVFITEAAGPMVAVPHVPAAPPAFRFDPEQALLWLLGAGVAWRVLLLAFGFIRLARYRRTSEPLQPPSEWGREAELLISPDISGPVTFGVRRPVVLLPPRFLEFDGKTVDAILCHEILHVRRKDWLFTIAEELLRAALWFHPAVWWVLSEIQLAREETVDRAAIALTRSRDGYVDALLTIAGGVRESELAPAPLFLRRRHLKQRVVSIFQEGAMSQRKKITAFVASMVLLAASCWLTTGALPLQAAPQMVVDSAGVSVRTGGAELIHRTAVAYPREGIRQQVQGEVVAELKLDSAGNVADARILSGPEELRKSVLQSVLSWHFSKDSAGSTRQIAVTFSLPEARARMEQFDASQKAFEKGAMADFAAREAAKASAAAAEGARVEPRTVAFIRVESVDDKTRAEILSKLPAGAGSPFTPESLQNVMTVLKGIDEHLILRPVPGTGNKTGLVVTLAALPASPGPAAPAAVPAAQPAPDSSAPGPIRVGGEAAQANRIVNAAPVYPPMAKQARIQGTVTFEAVIGKDGLIKNLRLVSGHPLLIQSAMAAVQQWAYKPTLLNGNPVEVITTIDVNYSLLDLQ